MKTRIIIDSTTDMLPELKNRLTVVPLTVHFGNEEYIDGVTIDHQRFYEMLVESDALPTTSQATPASFDRVFRTLEEGEGAVVLTLASSLSGTCQSAMIAAADYQNVHVVDTGTATIGAGILAELAMQLAKEGMSAGEITARLEQEKQRIRIIAMVDTLEYLQKGGRVSKALAIAGGLLNIKPVLSVKNGEITMLGKARGSRQGNNLLVTEIQKAGGVDFNMPVLLGYTGLSDALLQKYIRDSAALWENSRDALQIAQVGSVIGTHAGPGAIAVAFFANK
jgi:DegV family protein with EDD domain